MDAHTGIGAAQLDSAIRCPLPGSPPTSATSFAFFVPYDESGRAFLNVVDGHAVLPSWVLLGAANGGWLSGGDAPPVAVRFDVQDGRPYCIVDDGPIAAAFGWIRGRVTPCTDWVTVSGCRSGALVGPAQDCAFQIAVEDGEVCAWVAAPLDLELVLDEGTVLAASEAQTVTGVGGVTQRVDLVLAPRPPLGLGVVVEGRTVVHPGAQSFLQGGDLLLEVDGTRIGRAEDVTRALEGAMMGYGVPIRVERAGVVHEFWAYPVPLGPY